MTPQEHAELDKRVGKLCGLIPSQAHEGSRVFWDHGKQCTVRIPEYSSNWNACMEAVRAFCSTANEQQLHAFSCGLSRAFSWCSFPATAIQNMAILGPAAVCQALVEAWEKP